MSHRNPRDFLAGIRVLLIALAILNLIMVVVTELACIAAGGLFS